MLCSCLLSLVGGDDAIPVGELGGFDEESIFSGY